MILEGLIISQGGITLETPPVTPPPGNTVTTVMEISGWGQTVSAESTAIAAGTITGPAPLSIFFDATQTTATGYDSFREAGYHFDFGYATPTTPGSWTYNGEPKGNQIGGPVAAHVYDTPGTYIASIRAQSPNGDYDDKYVNVVVEDPETYWTTGGRTTTTLVRSSISTWPTWASNTRYLLEAGEDYSTLTSSTVNIRNVQNVCLAKTGIGADPIVSNLRFNYSTGAVPSTGARVIFQNINSLGELNAPVTGDDCLFYNCSGQNPIAGTLYTLGRNQNTALTWYRPRRIFYWECTFDGEDIHQPYFTQTYQLAVVGCTSTLPVEHGCRVQGTQYAFFGHNWFHNQNVAKHALTFRASGIDNLSPYTDSSGTTLSPASRYIVSADNLLSDGTETNSTWPLYIGPQDSGSVESLEYVIAERTVYTYISGGWQGQPTYAAIRGCRQITVRDDVYLQPATTAGTGSYPADWGANPPEWNNGPLYSNTYLSPPDNIDAFLTPTGILPAKAGT